MSSAGVALPTTETGTRKEAERREWAGLEKNIKKIKVSVGYHY